VRCPKALPPARRFLGPRDPISSANTDLLRGLVWCCLPLGDPRLDDGLGALAEQTYKRIPGHGPCCRKVANACIQVLGERGGRGAVAELQRLAQRVRYAQGRALVERTLERAAAKVGLARPDLEDLSVPSFGLGADGVLRRPFGAAAAELRLAGSGGVEVAWIAAGGRARAPRFRRT
jgi:hypothetical protein